MSVRLPNQFSRISRRKFLIGSGAAAASLAVYAGEIARHEIDIVDRPIPIRNLPNPFHDFRILQVSDFHLDEYTEPFFLERIVNRINGLNPDCVVLTGDFVTVGALTAIVRNTAPRCAEILSAIACPLRYAILGNHDVGFSSSLVTDALQARGIPVLTNRSLPIELGGSRILICGVDDPATSTPDLNLAVPAHPQCPVLLLAHEPDYADTVIRHPRFPLIDLMLAGHAHGGQIRLPGLGPLVLPPMGKKYPEGLFRFGQMQLYVNRGIGTVGLPFRLNCPPEITILTLKPAV
jgi:predicted MPP superfamily phosphohydrolase